MPRHSRRQALAVIGLQAIRGFTIVGALGAPNPVWSQPLVPVRLLVLRRPGLSIVNECIAPCIRGSIYDVSDLGDAGLDTTVVAALGTRKPICDVIERPWKDNAPNKSSIQRGKYKAKIRDEPTKNWMKGAPNKAWRLELEGTPHRTAIQFHYGTDVDWSQGCFIVGSLLQSGDAKGLTAAYCKLEGSEAAVAALRDIVTASGRNPQDIRIGIADSSEIFPNYRPLKPC